MRLIFGITSLFLISIGAFGQFTVFDVAFGDVVDIPSCTTGLLYSVVDGVDLEDCTVGGGSNTVSCICDGVNWVPLALVSETVDGTGVLNEFAIWSPDSDTITNSGRLKQDGTGIVLSDLEDNRLRLGQDGSSDWSNELSLWSGSHEWWIRTILDNLWFRDHTNGNEVIKFNSGAPTNSIVLNPSGDLGVGINPTQDFHVQKTGENTIAFVESTTANTVAYKLKNANRAWQIQIPGSGSDLIFWDNANAAGPLLIEANSPDQTLRIESTGVEVNGTLELPDYSHCDLKTDGSGNATCGVDADTIFTPNANPGVDHSSYVAGHSNGTNCAVGQYARGTDANGNAENCTIDADTFHGNGSNCSSNFTPLGVDQNGAVESCWEPARVTSTTLNNSFMLGDGTGKAIKSSTIFVNTATNSVSGIGEYEGDDLDIQLGPNDIEGDTTVDTIFYESIANIVSGSRTACFDTLDHELGRCSSTQLVKNIEGDLSFERAIEILQALKPQLFTWKENSDFQELGFIAEEVHEVDFRLTLKEDNGTPYGVNTQAIVSVLVTGYKELLKQNRELDRRLTILEERSN